MDAEINNLHQQISNLLNEAVGPKGTDLGSGDVQRMTDAERRLLVNTRRASGPYAGGEWRKALI
ncbi:MAG: hypothetical protein RIA64_15510 [Rhodospirillales bacterium]